jgi:hypothetical protein
MSKEQEALDKAITLLDECATIIYGIWESLDKVGSKSLIKNLLPSVQESTQLLIDLGIDFTVHNNGLHLIIRCDRGIIDFWPSTGRWVLRGDGGCNPKGRSVQTLLGYINRDNSGE